jgi:predicted GNAT family acetyltransferase
MNSLETKDLIKTHPSDPERGYSIDGREFLLSLDPSKLKAIEGLRKGGTSQSDIDRFVAELEAGQQQIARAHGRRTAIEVGGKVVHELDTLVSFSHEDSSLEDQPMGWGTVMLLGKETKFRESTYNGGQNNGLYARKRIEARHGAGVARVSYAQRLDTNEIIIEGLLLSEDLRGQGMGLELLQLFMEGAKRKGLTIKETSSIRKPMIAKLLEKAGFSVHPEDKKDKITATILGETRVDTQLGDEEKTVPVVHVDGDADAIKKAIDESQSNGQTHYVVANGSDVGESMHKELVDKIDTLPTEEEKRRELGKRRVTLGVRWLPPGSKDA